MSLLAPLFLLGLLTALVPWWLHRLSASNPPRSDFGSTRFLEPNQSPSSSKRRTKYWPLLLLRLLFLALLCFIFAEPVIEQLRSLGTSNTRHILVIDTSMSQKLDGRWQQTIDTANQVLNNASDGDRAVVIAAANQFVQSQQDSDSIDAARQQLATLQPGNTRLDYGSIGTTVSAALDDDGLNHHLHVITDTQATAMPERFTALAVDKIQSINVYSSASDSDSNTAITGRVEQINGDNASVIAVVNNYGPAATHTVLVSSNGVTLGSAQVAAESNQSAIHRFENINITDTESQLELRLSAEDSLADDNTWLLPLPDKNRTEITLLGSDVQPSVANTYIAAALESNPRFEARLIDATRFAPADAGNLIIVPNASVLSDRTASRLNDYINDGGNALIAVSDRPHSTGAASLLGFSSNAQPVAEAANVTAIDPAHEVTANLQNNWRTVYVLQHHQLQPGITDRTLIELSNGSPLLVEKRLGSGKALLLATALNPTWTNLPTESVFVAFIMQSVEFLGGDTSTALYRSTGDTINVAAGAQLIDPDGNSMRELTGISERASIPLQQAGVYQLRSSAGTQAIAVNFEPLESDIRPIDNATLERWQQVATSDAIAAQSGSNASITSENNQKTFWMWLLPLLLLLTLLESLYSHRHLWIRREA